MSVVQLAQAMDVTATAVRQRLLRLMEQGCIERISIRAGRGRPSHEYSLTKKGRERAGSNLSDLAVAVWHEIAQIEDSETRRMLVERVSKRLVEKYAEVIQGVTVDEKMASLVTLFSQRQVPYAVDQGGKLPVLKALSCPYPGLADKDRRICSLEKSMISELLGEEVSLSQCRLDGHHDCSFVPARENDDRYGDSS